VSKTSHVGNVRSIHFSRCSATQHQYQKPEPPARYCILQVVYPPQALGTFQLGLNCVELPVLDDDGIPYSSSGSVRTCCHLSWSGGWGLNSSCCKRMDLSLLLASTFISLIVLQPKASAPLGSGAAQINPQYQYQVIPSAGTKFNILLLLLPGSAFYYVPYTPLITLFNKHTGNFSVDIPVKLLFTTTTLSYHLPLVLCCPNKMEEKYHSPLPRAHRPTPNQVSQPSIHISIQTETSPRRGILQRLTACGERNKKKKGKTGISGFDWSPSARSSQLSNRVSNFFFQFPHFLTRGRLYE